VHLCDEVFICEVGFTLWVEAAGGVIGVDGGGEFGEGREEDAVSFFELPKAEVAEGDAEDGGDEDVRAEGGAHPDDVVVSPSEADFGLVFEVVDDAVAALSSVEEVTGDDDF